MSLVSITRSALDKYVDPSELPGIFALQTEIADIIEEVCDRVVLAVNSSEQYRAIRTGRSKVPPELVHATLVLCRHACISKAPGTDMTGTLEGGIRATEYREAQDLLKRVEQGDLTLADYTIGADPDDLVSDEEDTGSLAWGSEPFIDTSCLFAKNTPHE